MIVTGVVRHLFWGLPQYDAAHLVGAVPVEHCDGLVMGGELVIAIDGLIVGQRTSIEGRVSALRQKTRDGK
ncbi:hypothetical protein BH09ACT8_BH09ACT8_10760 [soil metagenome]